jgi:hypothetical protein
MIERQADYICTLVLSSLASPSVLLPPTLRRVCFTASPTVACGWGWRTHTYGVHGHWAVPRCTVYVKLALVGQCNDQVRLLYKTPRSPASCGHFLAAYALMQLYLLIMHVYNDMIAAAQPNPSTPL